MKTSSMEWYLPDSDQNEAQGPFTTEDMIVRLKKGLVRWDDYTWSPHLGESKWRRFIELKEFASILRSYPRCPLPKMHSRGLAARKKRVAFNFTQQGEYGSENTYRRFPRAPLDAEVIISDDRVYRHGHSVDISEKGLFLVLDDVDAFQRGRDVRVTIRNVPGIGTFSVTGIVIRSISNDKVKGLGLFFLRLNPFVKRQIARYVLGQLEAKTRKGEEVA